MKPFPVSVFARIPGATHVQYDWKTRASFEWRPKKATILAQKTRSCRRRKRIKPFQPSIAQKNTYHLFIPHHNRIPGFSTWTNGFGLSWMNLVWSAGRHYVRFADFRPEELKALHGYKPSQVGGPIFFWGVFGGAENGGCCLGNYK